MPSVRERVLDAAIALLAGDGVRGLTHRRVDDTAGVPRGSTSNYFRTRDALLEGVFAHLLAADRRVLERPGPAWSPSTVDELATAIAAQLHEALTTHREATLARYAVVSDPRLGPASRQFLGEARTTLRSWLADVLTGIGAADPIPTAHLLLAAMDGLILHSLTEPPTDLPALAHRLVHHTVSLP